MPKQVVYAQGVGDKGGSSHMNARGLSGECRLMEQVLKLWKAGDRLKRLALG